MADQPARVAVILIGYYRTGKGTIAKKFKAQGCPVWDTGRELAALAEKNPQDARLDPVRKGTLVACETVMRFLRLWIIALMQQNPAHKIAVFDGIFRKDTQLEVIQFLRERGYRVIVIHLTTPPEVCDARPPRPGRIEDVDPTIIANRQESWEKNTVPVFGQLASHGISLARGNLIEIVNRDQSEEQTYQLVYEFVEQHRAVLVPLHKRLAQPAVPIFMTTSPSKVPEECLSTR
ncbi:MAG: hypothetical protein V4697_02040 [Patescibacteria group bacterium]